MAIKKQEFYEGAALHLIIRSGRVKSIHYDPPFFFLNDRLTVLLKYCTKVRSPWGFTFTRDEQQQLSLMSDRKPTVIGLVCGSDGIVALPYESYSTIASIRAASAYVSCYRDHGEHYEINGPDGPLKYKVAPSSWQRILESGVGDEAQRTNPKATAQADRQR